VSVPRDLQLGDAAAIGALQTRMESELHQQYRRARAALDGKIPI
jgi:hypothetical protein